MKYPSDGDEFKLVIIMQKNSREKSLRTYTGNVVRVSGYGRGLKYRLTHTTSKFVRTVNMDVHNGRVKLVDALCGRPINKYALYINGKLVSQSRGGINLYHTL